MIWNRFKLPPPSRTMFCDPMSRSVVRSFSFRHSPLLPFGKKLILMPPEKNINRVYRRSSASTLDSSNYLRGRRTISRYCDEEGYNNEERAPSGPCLGTPAKPSCRAKTGPLSSCNHMLKCMLDNVTSDGMTLAKTCFWNPLWSLKHQETKPPFKITLACPQECLTLRQALHCR